MDAPQKLTKKQKKGIAFRDRGKTPKSKSKSHGAPTGLEDNEVPVMEDQALADAAPDTPAVEVAPKQGGPGAAKGKGKGKEKAKTGDAVDAAPSQQKKRKRDESVGGGDVAKQPEGDAEGPKRKKKKGSSGAAGVADEAGKGAKAPESQVKQRFILFVGNLKYTTTAEAVKAHFAACDPPPTVRLRSPKAVPGKPANKSKGCAFVEFSHRNALQQGLKLHQSELEGRKINVELTVGGGGKSDTRLNKLKERNKGLFDQRKDRVEKLAKSDPNMSSVLDLPQRFSATSGLEQVQSKARTWTIGDEGDAETHRGGKKHTKARRPPGRQWGTGVNAIPVG
ncbi:hypothetical protein B0H17DRAFT_1161621 [Mycena rosella]|uniref:RRM domain-containing protein n=1 Tax=Mycena rosella TaxID=1033263 RepID=A0AAD7D3T2_MYCRO|nr:hypothetical protein B0H17DRAFT_1161621 [Mycena rosella]